MNHNSFITATTENIISSVFRHPRHEAVRLVEPCAVLAQRRTAIFDKNVIVICRLYTYSLVHNELSVIMPVSLGECRA